MMQEKVNYLINSMNEFNSSNYILLSISNFAVTSGIITNIGSNNDATDTNAGVLKSYAIVQTRDYASVVVGIPKIDASFPNMRWGTFNGEDCIGSIKFN